MNPKLISIIIVVKNDPRIFSLIDKLLSSKEEIEIIVVDASDQKSVLPVAKDPRVRWFFYNQKGLNRTIVKQRNYGLKKAHGKAIVFIDADCEPTTEWLHAITEPLLSKKEYVTTGPIIVKGYMQQPRRSHYVRFAGNGNLAFNSEVVKKVGYYDEEMTVAQDYEYCIRMRKKKYKIAFIDQAAIFHPNDSFKKNFSKGIIYGEGAVKLYFKHPSEIGFHSHFLYTVFYGSYILFLPVTLFFPYYPLIIVGPALMRFPRSPLKEIVNLSFGVGVLVGCLKRILNGSKF